MNWLIIVASFGTAITMGVLTQLEMRAQVRRHEAHIKTERARDEKGCLARSRIR